MKFWPPFLRKSAAPTPALGVVHSAKRSTPPAPAAPTPALGTSATHRSGEYDRFGQVMAHLGSPDPQAGARKAIIGFHALLRDRASFPNLANEIIARTVGLYRQTNYLGGRLRTSVSGADLRMIEQNIREFLALLGNPATKLPGEVRQQMLSDEPYARFQAGVFALARGRYESALEHFTRAASFRQVTDFSGWGVNPETILRSLQLGLNQQAVASLGRLFTQLTECLPAVEETPAPLDLTKPVRLPPLQPAFPTVQPVSPPRPGAPATTFILSGSELSHPTDNVVNPTAPGTSNPRTRRD